MADLRDAINRFTDEISSGRKSNPLPDNSCAYIDKVQESIESAEKNASRGERRADSVEEAKECLSEIENELCDCESQLEEVRRINEQLRENCKFWYRLAVESNRIIAELYEEENVVTA